MNHEDVPYANTAQLSWTDCAETVQAGATYLTGSCPRCKGRTTRRVGVLVVQGGKEAPTVEPFPVSCECGHETHTGRPERAPLGCGAYWFSQPVKE